MNALLGGQKKSKEGPERRPASSDPRIWYLLGSGPQECDTSTSCSSGSNNNDSSNSSSRSNMTSSPASSFSSSSPSATSSSGQASLRPKLLQTSVPSLLRHGHHHHHHHCHDHRHGLAACHAMPCHCSHCTMTGRMIVAVSGTGAVTSCSVMCDPLVIVHLASVVIIFCLHHHYPRQHHNNTM